MGNVLDGGFGNSKGIRRATALKGVALEFIIVATSQE
jgi:hypothetical protein